MIPPILFQTPQHLQLICPSFTKLYNSHMLCSTSLLSSKRPLYTCLQALTPKIFLSLLGYLILLKVLIILKSSILNCLTNYFIFNKIFIILILLLRNNAFSFCFSFWTKPKTKSHAILSLKKKFLVFQKTIQIRLK